MKCILHIGTEKTGTTLLQNWLYDNKESLKKNKIFFPSKMGGKQHFLLPAYFQSNPDLWNTNIIRQHVPKLVKPFYIIKDLFKGNYGQAYKERFMNLAKKEIESAKAKKIFDIAIITSEHFHSRIKNVEDLKNLRHFLFRFFDNVTVICYFREQFDLALSLYSTALKAGSTAYIEEFLRNVTPKNYYYNNLLIANNYSSVFGTKNCIFKIYDRELFFEKDIRKDFIYSIKKNINLKEFTWNIISSNESLFALQAVAFREINQKLSFWNSNRSVRNKKNIQAKMQILNNDLFRKGNIYSNQSSVIKKLFEKSNQEFFKKYFHSKCFFKEKKIIETNSDLLLDCQKTVNTALEQGRNLEKIKKFG